MAKVDGSLGSLVQGVSQQPSRARNPGQAEEQINVTNDEVFGLSRRPSTEVVSAGAGFAVDAGGLNVVEHGTIRMQEELLTYTLRIVDDAADTPQMRILKDGVSHDVVFPTTAAEDYLRADGLVNTYGRRVLFKEMDDKVFIMNMYKTVLKDTGTRKSEGVASDQNDTVVYCRGGQFAVGYTLRFDIAGVQHLVSFTTPDGGFASNTEKAQVKYIIQQLWNLVFLVDAGGNTGNDSSNPEHVDPLDSGWVGSANKYYASLGAQAAIAAAFDSTMIGEHLVFAPINNALVYTITASETTASDLLVDVRDEIKDVGRLPTRSPQGKVVRVVGSNSAEDDYFLQWNIEGTALNSLIDKKGIWEEATDPDEDYRLDGDTLPHELYLDGATYKIRSMEWEHRSAGSDLSNPFPNFVDTVITDIGDFQGRAVFLSGNTVGMSRTDEYTNWFGQTATAVLATDPISMRSTSTDGDSRLVFAVPYNRDLVIFGTNNSQFIISGRDTLTGDNASMVLTSEFEADLTTRPQSIGDGVMFLSWTGKFTHVHEMFLEGTQNNHARRTVTDHVPRYLVGRGKVFAANDGANAALVVTDDDPTTAFLYESLWIDARRVQSAWSKWTFSGDIEHIRVDRGVMTATFKTSSGGFLTTTAELNRSDEDTLDFPLHLDYSSEHVLTDDDTLVVDCTGLAGDLDNITVVAIDGTAVHGMPLTILSVVADTETLDANTCTVTLAASYTGTVKAGTRFLSRFVPTMPVLRDGDGVAIVRAELNVSEFDITFDKTGPFNMIRQSTYEAPEDWWNLAYAGRTLGDPDFNLGTAPIDSDVIAFPFADLSTTSKLVIECDTHLPMTLTEIEWRGSVRNRSRRLTNGG